MANLPPRQLHLNAFLRNIGQHEAAWRLPETNLNRLTDIDHYIELAQTAERGKLDAIFFADHPVHKDRAEDRPFDVLDPFTLIAALSTATKRIGLVSTASTTYNDPYNLARRYATLDHLSKGRAAWNAVTTANADAAANFGLELHPDPAARYARADEFIEIAHRLWDSWQDDAILADKANGRFVDPDRIQPIDHEGTHFKVRGPLEIPRSPQGRPVLFQAGSSVHGIELAARHADAVFTAQPDFDNARAFYQNLKSRVVAHGRDPAQVLILPGLSFFIGDTEAAAQALRTQFDELTLPTYGLEQLNRITGLDYTVADLDKRFELGDTPRTQIASRAQLLRHIAQTESITVRALLHRLSAGRGHRSVTGTPEQVVEFIVDWFSNGAADGFNLIPPALPTSLATFVGQVVPLLQRRGLFREEYTGTTLREHLGLPRPLHPSAQVAPLARAA